ncbi:YbaN family protein [Youngiibacter multivorans]|uniref:Uncharacterized membrane protein YbaN (DUF454 family) n=1 Tax=Youngiibacter multivorans TaxID=937251 RepID=A0ABS4G2B3_9CLOT|nr:YbaN family protein [Youngiibacter multivorans]MBP1918687.1 uncharacterized membrane protein YbaN (DUF454 family) [Youngiibacter multivorans]
MNIFIRYMLMGVGSLSFALGLAGVFLPIIPTTPFLLLSAACWMRSSEKAYTRLLSHRKFGPAIRDYSENGTISVKTKVVAIVLMSLGIGSTIIFFTGSTFVRLILLAVAVSVGTYVGSRPSS